MRHSPILVVQCPYEPPRRRRTLKLGGGFACLPAHPRVCRAECTSQATNILETYEPLYRRCLLFSGRRGEGSTQAAELAVKTKTSTEVCIQSHVPISLHTCSAPA